MTSKDEETGNVSKLRTLYSKIQKANSMTDSKHQQKLIGEFEDKDWVKKRMYERLRDQATDGQ